MTRAQQTHDSFVRQESNIITLIRTEATAENNLLRTEISSEDQSGNNEVSVLRSKYEEHMNTIRVVMQTEFRGQRTDAVRRNEMLRDEAARAQV